MNKLLLLERGIAFCFRLRRTQLSFDFWFFLLVFTFDDCTLIYLSVSTYRLDLFSRRDQVSRTLLYLLLLDFSARDDWHVTWLASRKTPPPRLLLLLFSRVAVGKKNFFFHFLSLCDWLYFLLFDFFFWPTCDGLTESSLLIERCVRPTWKVDTFVDYFFFLSLFDRITVVDSWKPSNKTKEKRTKLASIKRMNAFDAHTPIIFYRSNWLRSSSEWSPSLWRYTFVKFVQWCKEAEEVSCPTKI